MPKFCIQIVSSILHITSQVEYTKKCNSSDSESNSAKQNTNHQNRLTLYFSNTTIQ